MEDSNIKFLEQLLERLANGSKNDDQARERDLWAASVIPAANAHEVLAKLHLFQRLYWPSDTPPMADDLEGQLLKAIVRDMERLLSNQSG